MRRRSKRYPWPWQAYLALGYEFDRNRRFRITSGVAVVVGFLEKATLRRSFHDAFYPNLRYGT